MEKSKGLDTVIEAIKSRRELCQNDIKSMENETINKLKKIFPTDINSLTLNDIMLLSPKDRNTLIDLVGLEQNYFNFDEENSYVELFKFVNNYIKGNNERIAKMKEAILKCDMYEEVLTTKSKNHDLLPNSDDFHNFIDSLGGLSDYDKGLVERKFIEYNLNANVLDPEIRQGVNYTVSEINQHQDVKETILKNIKEQKLKVDINFIPTYAKNIAEICGNTPEMVESIMYGMLLEQETARYNKDKNVEHLTRMHRILNEFRYDDMKVIISEANRIIRREMASLVSGNLEFRDIVVEDSQTEAEFEDKKHEKLSMIAALLKREIENFENSNNRELKDKHKELIKGFIDEYNNVNGMIYKPVQGRTL